MDSATGSIITEDTLVNRQAPIPTGPLSKSEAAIVELAIIGRQAPIPGGQPGGSVIDIDTVSGRQQAIIEAQKRLEAAIVELNVVNG